MVSGRGQVAADVERYRPGEAVERYTTNFGPLAIIRDRELWADSKPTYLLSPFNDQVVEPIADEHGNLYVGADEAAWIIKLKNGTKYRYGFTDQSSLFQILGLPNMERKVALVPRPGRGSPRQRDEVLLRRISEPAGSLQTDGPPGDRVRNPGSPNQQLRLVVSFNYVEAPSWERSSFTLGTRVDSRFLVDRVCTYANTHVYSQTVDDRLYWGVSDPFGVELTVPGPCTELTYDFEDVDGNGARHYPASYTGRPLLMKVQQVAPDGARLPPWEMTYEQQGRSWTDPYRASLAANGEPLELPANAELQLATRGIEQMAIDLNADGVTDFVSGSSLGHFNVTLGAMVDTDADGLLDRYTPSTSTSWANPLRDHAEPAQLSWSLNSKFGESADSDCWYFTDVHVNWTGSSSGLGYARSLTAAPPDFDAIYDHASDEAENQFVDLGGFRFLQSSYIGPPPAIGDDRS